MEMSKFEELMALVADMDGARTILGLMSGGFDIDISRCNGGTHLCIDRYSPLYSRLKNLLEDFVSEVEKKIEMIEIKEG